MSVLLAGDAMLDCGRAIHSGAIVGDGGAFGPAPGAAVPYCGTGAGVADGVLLGGASAVVMGAYA